MMDDARLLRALTSKPPADPGYRPRLSESLPGARIEAPVDERARTRPRTRAVIGLAVALAVALMAMLLGGLLPASSPPRELNQRTYGPFLPDVLPDGAASGSLETPLGPARWVHLVRGPAEIPFGRVLPGPTGLLLSTGGLASTDGIEWTPHVLPIHTESSLLTFSGGAYWLTTTGPTSLWRSTDALAWSPVDLSALVTPVPADLDWELILGTPVSGAGATVIPVTHRVRDPGQLLGQAPTHRQEWPQEVSPGIFDVMQGTPRGELAVDRVLIRALDDGLRVSEEDGRLITRLDGVDLGFIRAWSARHSIERHGIGIISDGTVEPVALPDVPYPDPAAVGAPVLLDTPDGYRAFAPAPDGEIRAWHSVDGSGWVGVPSPGPAWDVWTEIGYGRPSRVWMHGASMLATTDGLEWHDRPGLRVTGGEFHFGPSEGGAIPENPDWSSLTLAAGSDGEERIPIPGLSVDSPADQPYESVQSVVGNTIFIMNLRPAGTAPEHEMWIIELEPRLP
jgi:hypothetical protein